jgi:hypothetical protein
MAGVEELVVDMLMRFSLLTRRDPRPGGPAIDSVSFRSSKLSAAPEPQP